MFIVQQKKRKNQSNGQGQQTRKRKKKRKGRSNQRCQCGGNLLHWVCSNHAFLLFFLSVFVPIEFLFSGRNVWYTLVWLVLFGIGWYLERYILKVFWYRFIDWYEKFRPYRPVRYGINFLGISIRFPKNISFYHLKSYFIYYTISFYNTPNIPTFIFLYNTLK